jgi:hypothetical protein
MHTWISLATIKSSNLYNVKKVLANRPKGLKDEQWKAFVAEEKLNKKIVLNAVPKPSRKAPAKQSDND